MSWAILRSQNKHGRVNTGNLYVNYDHYPTTTLSLYYPTTTLPQPYYYPTKTLPHLVIHFYLYRIPTRRTGQVQFQRFASFSKQTIHNIT